MKIKNQVIHKQKFKDPLSGTCPLSSERSVRLGIRIPREVFLSPLGVTFRHWIFFCFHVVKPLKLILALLPISSSL